MKIEKFTLNSLYDSLPLSCCAYLPEGEPKGIFQIVHGMCEYKERYDDFMRFLAENGLIAAAHDHRGHGKSVKEEADLGWFGDKKARAVVEDAVLVTRKLKERYPNLPVTLFGHSMGSMVVRCYIQNYDDEIDRLIVCGSPSKIRLRPRAWQWPKAWLWSRVSGTEAIPWHSFRRATGIRNSPAKERAPG